MDNQFKAAAEGNFFVVEKMVSANNVNQPGRNERTVLHEACSGGHVAIVSWLVRLGANVNALSQSTLTPLCYATGARHLECAVELLEAGADPMGSAALWGEEHASVSQIPFHNAARNGYDEFFEPILRVCPRSVFILNSDGVTALGVAIIHGQLEACRKLIALGSDIGFVDRQGRSLLYLALARNSRPIAELLIDNGVSLRTLTHTKIVPFCPDWAVKRFLLRTSMLRLCIALLGLRRCSSRIISSNGRDVLRMIARMVWNGEKF